MEEVTKSDAEWRAVLDPDTFQVLRRGATERPFTGKYVNEKRNGVYRCAGCGAQLFASDTKFESGSGWPSFTQPIADERVATKTDTSHGMIRTEILCAACGGHLGHVFDDGPNPTGLRYCVNSLSLDLEPGS
jgi:peptide-methionine (R)-S-oxide reductase